LSTSIKLFFFDSIISLQTKLYQKKYTQKIKPMKKKFNLLLMFLFSINSFSQVGINTTTPHASSMLDINATDKGLLIPRVSISNLNAAAPITTPATSLLVYNTNVTTGAGFYYWDSAKWTPFGSSGWGITGNSGTTPASNFLGTTDAQDLVIKANNTEAIRVKTNGSIGIGTNNPQTKLHIETTGATTFTQNFDALTTGNVTTTAGTNPYQIINGGTCTVTNAWKIGSTFSSVAPCATCSTKGAYINYSSSCSQDDSLIVGPYTATSTSATVSFNYSYDDFSGNDSFVVILYNETTSTTISTLLTLTADALSQSYTSGALTVVSGQNYSVRFKYIGNNDMGAIVDNVSITFASPNGALRIVDGTQAVGKVLTSDASGNASWAVPALSISGSNLSISGGNTVAIPSGSYTFTNGLTNMAGTVKLGGTLTEDTTIAATVFPFNVSSATKPNMLRVDNNEDVVKFGHDGTLSDEGASLTIDGYATTVKYITSAKNGFSSRGTAIGVGSIEYLVDGEATIASSFSITPTVTNLYDLGTSTSRWKNIYLQNAPIVTSDVTLKKNIKELGYGLKEIMKLNPISYQWKNDYIGETFIPENQRETSLGFSAQELLTVLPEVVKTHDWKIISEETPDQYQYLKNDKLGVIYSQIIPVTVKAIQEQQTQIEELKKAVEELKKQNELLLQLVNKK
jgi:hypothetical protein